MIKLSTLYTETIESICTRILYFFNTIDTYFIVAAALSFFAVFFKIPPLAALTLCFLIAYTSAKLADFYPLFVVWSIAPLIFLLRSLSVPFDIVLKLTLLNIGIFFIVQFIFMGLPETIVSRDFRVPFIKFYHSLYTFAPTTVSFSMSVFFSFFLSIFLSAAFFLKTPGNFGSLIIAAILILAGAMITRIILPKNHFSKFHKPDTLPQPLFKRVVYLNIDGTRKDIFDALNLPTRDLLIKEGASCPKGLETVYRALTNPAFASILTGTVPNIHKVTSNNCGQSIQVEALPDIAPSILYGSMHVKHFSKKTWETRIVSLPRHSAYFCDDIMVGWLKEDLLQRTDIRLFVADFSEADFLAHAYGSTSNAYRDALTRIDRRIGELLGWMKTNGALQDTAIIVSSDHGIAAIDHSYLLFSSERFVPFFVLGEGIKKNFKILRPGKIMDICCTIAYLLGVPYPSASRGQVFTEILEGRDRSAETDVFITRFNQLKYDAECLSQTISHPEVTQGDAPWWNDVIKTLALHSGSDKTLRILDIGCGHGFIAEMFLKNNVNLKKFVCFDVSEKALEAARKKFHGSSKFFFSSNSDDIRGLFDIITVSSVFHHVQEPEKLADFIDLRLAQGGLLIGSHEPNKNAFKNIFFLIASDLYKRIGGGISVNNATVAAFNKLLQERYPLAPEVSREEILQIVEYHSPLEQYDTGVDVSSGFMPRDFIKTNFPKYRIERLDTYTTFFCREATQGRPVMQKILKTIHDLLFKEGNLFRFVLRK